MPVSSFVRPSVAAVAISALLGIVSPGAAAAHPSIDVVASNWKFTPATVEMHVGETTTLQLSSSGGVHGIASGELGIPSTMIQPGKTVQVDVTPKTAGTYKVHCSIMCGAGHPNMMLTVDVVE